MRSDSSRSAAFALPGLSLRHLRLAVAAADEGSFRRTAEHLSIRQSTISRTIRDFEGALGTKLFDRTSGGIAPTPSGLVVIQAVRRMLAELDGLVAESRSGRHIAGNRFAVGFCSSLSTGSLRATLLDYCERHSRAGLVLVEKTRTRLARMLRIGTLDVVISAEDISFSGCKALPLWSERILVSLPKDHGLTQQDVVYWTDLRNQTILLSRFDAVEELEQVVRSKLTSVADRPAIERNDVSRNTANVMVSMRMGLGLVLESDLGTTTSIYRELRDGSGPTRLDFFAFWLPDNDNRKLVDFLHLLRERYPSFSVDA